MEFELSRLELIEELGLVELQPRVLGTHLEVQKCRFGNQHVCSEPTEPMSKRNRRWCDLIIGLVPTIVEN